jgi:prolyl-tRNA synthetase
MPVRVTVGDRGIAEGIVEVRVRRTGEVTKAPISEALPEIQRTLAGLQ